MSRNWIGASAIVGVVAVFAGGWAMADAFQSPAQREFAARPPAARPILVKVEAGRLRDEITARADVAPRSSERLLPQALPSPAVVTGAGVGQGDAVNPWSVLLILNGRPVFVVPGQFSFYRNIEAGMTGPDVRQLQDGLTAAGYAIPSAEMGIYGPATQQAVTQAYAARGVEPMMRSGGNPDGGDAPTAETEATADDEAATTIRQSKSPRAATQPSPVVPMDEVVVARHLPATLAAVKPVGASPATDKPLATLASGPLVAHAGVARSVVGRIRRGMAALLVTDDGHRRRARVDAVGSAAASKGNDLEDVTLEARGASLPDAWRGTNVLARIIVRTPSRKALIVPTRAVAEDARLRSSVLKREAHGSFAKVLVRTLSSLAGRSAVVPVVQGTLRPGDRIRVD